MAEEISTRTQLRLRNGELIDAHSSPSIKLDQSNAWLVRAVQTIGTTAEVLAGSGLPDIVQPGLMVFNNLELVGGPDIEVGYYDLGGPTFYPVLKVKPGEYGMSRLSPTFAWATGLRAKASSGTAELFYIIYDN